MEGSTVVGSATATGGNWSITATALSSGVHSLTARATDAAGNQTTSAALSVTIDTSAPGAPSAPDLTDGSDTGVSNSDNLTKNTTPTFSGTAEAGATVTLLEGATTLGTAMADGSRNWTITSSSLADGVHNITVRATDAAGNAGPASSRLRLRSTPWRRSLPRPCCCRPTIAALRTVMESRTSTRRCSPAWPKAERSLNCSMAQLWWAAPLPRAVQESWPGPSLPLHWPTACTC